MKIFIQTLLTLFLISTALPAIAKSKEDSPVDNKSTYHISDNIDLVTTTDIKYTLPRTVIKLTYPRLTSSDDSANQEENSNLRINAFNEQVARIINEEVTDFKNKVQEAAEAQKSLPKSKIKNRLTVDFNSAIINLDDQPIISIRFVAQGYVAGMKEPFRHYRSLNFDMEAGSEIQLADIFKADSDYFNVIAEFANDVLSKKLRSYSPSSSTAPSADQFKNWNINLRGIRITFDPATIAPAQYGSQTILVPYAKIKEIINSDSALGRCLQHKRHCLGEHLLTGGFLDEAANTSHGRLDPLLT